MKQFVLPANFAGEGEITLTGSDFHYLCTVRRHRVDDTFLALDRRGNAYHATVTRVGGARVTVSLVPRAAPVANGPFVTLYQSLPKGSKMDQIVRQVTESGVRRIVPVISEHTIPQIGNNAEKKEKKLTRWRRIVEEAVQQSRAPVIPELTTPVTVQELGARRSVDELSLCFDSDADGASSLHSLLAEHFGPIGIAVGPEGGWSPDDRRRLTAAGFRPAYLGAQVLRTETAAVYAVAAVQIIALERDQWSTRSG